MMTKYICRLAMPLALGASVALAACTVKDNKSDTTLARDSALSSDLAMAGRDTSVQPALQDIPATPAGGAATTTPRAPVARPSTSGRTTAPAPTRTTTTRPAPTPRTTTTASGNTVTRNTGTAAGTSRGGVGTIAAGTQLNLASNARVCTNTFQVGQTFTARTTEAVAGSNGATIPAGSVATLEITELKRSDNARDNIVMGFRVVSLRAGGTTYTPSASVAVANVERVRSTSKSSDVQKVVGGAVIGAIAGQILGKNTKSTVIGAAAGGAAGAGAAAATANYEGCVGEGGTIVLTLNSPLQVKIS